MLSDSLVVFVILLGDEGYGDGIGGMKLGFIFYEAVAFPKFYVAYGDYFCLPRARYL